MASTITADNGSTSGVPGLKQSADSSGILQFAVGTGNTALTIDASNNVYGIAGSTSMANGFFYIPSGAGIPSGVPTTVTGRVPMYFDSANNDFYIYNTAWKKIRLA